LALRVICETTERTLIKFGVREFPVEVSGRDLGVTPCSVVVGYQRFG